MKASWTILALLAAGCVSTTREMAPDPRGVDTVKEKSSDELRAEREVQRTFETWMAASIAGDVKAHYEGMSALYISNWLWRCVENHQDQVIAKWLPLLPPASRQDLETWREVNNKARADRADIVPPSILGSEWLPKLYSEYFSAQLPIIRQTLSGTRVKQVAVEGPQATLTTSLNGQITEIYVMVLAANGKWVIDGYVPPLRPQ